MRKATLLGDWLAKNKESQGEFGRRLSPPVKSDMTNRWVLGKKIPTCLYAVAIENATGGAVPVRYWAELERLRAGKKKPKKRKAQAA